MCKGGSADACDSQLELMVNCDEERLLFRVSHHSTAYALGNMQRSKLFTCHLLNVALAPTTCRHINISIVQPDMIGQQQCGAVEGSPGACFVGAYGATFMLNAPMVTDLAYASLLLLYTNICTGCHHFCNLPTATLPLRTAALSYQHSRQQATLQQAHAQILRHANEKRDHIPPVTSTASATFPFDITMAR